MLYLNTKSPLMFPIKTLWVPPLKTHTTLAREPRFDAEEPRGTPKRAQESPGLPPKTLVLLGKNYRLRRSHLLFPIKNPLSASSRTHTILARELRFDFTNGFFYVGLILAFMTQEAITAKTSVLPKRNHGLRTNMSLWQKVEGKNSPRRWKKCTQKKQVFVHAFLASEPPKNFSFAEAKP